MSFSDSVREELYSRMNDQDKKYACLYGILLFGKWNAGQQAASGYRTGSSFLMHSNSNRRGAECDVIFRFGTGGTL